MQHVKGNNEIHFRGFFLKQNVLSLVRKSSLPKGRDIIFHNFHPETNGDGS